jgi:hypothetical protein
MGKKRQSRFAENRVVNLQSAIREFFYGIFVLIHPHLISTYPRKTIYNPPINKNISAKLIIVSAFLIILYAKTIIVFTASIFLFANKIIPNRSIGAKL